MLVEESHRRYEQNVFVVQALFAFPGTQATVQMQKQRMHFALFRTISKQIVQLIYAFGIGFDQIDRRCFKALIRTESTRATCAAVPAQFVLQASHFHVRSVQLMAAKQLPLQYAAETDEELEQYLSEPGLKGECRSCIPQQHCEHRQRHSRL